MLVLVFNSGKLKCCTIIFNDKLDQFCANGIEKFHLLYAGNDNCFGDRLAQLLVFVQ